MTNTSKYEYCGKSVYSIFNRRDYGYFYFLVEKKGMTIPDAIKETIATRKKRDLGQVEAKYMYKGKPIHQILNHRDYGYFQMLMNKRHIPAGKAYSMTLATKPQEGRRQGEAGNRKYFYKGKSIRDLFTENKDRQLFYANIYRKMTVKQAIENTFRTIKAREKQWERYQQWKKENGK